VIAVVHLVWGPLGPDPLRRFLRSYRECQPGVDHELVVLFNGVDSERRELLAAELDGIEHRLLTLPEPVQDLTAYAQAAECLEHERLCFLNSYSVLLAHDWLAALSDALDQPGSGLVGATGSWASLRAAVLNALLLPSPYRGAVPKRSVIREQMEVIKRELADEGSGASVEEMFAAGTSGEAANSRPSLAARVLATVKGMAPMPEQLLRFQEFPAHHLRTNAFMVERALFASLEKRAIKRKMDAYLLESGRNSFTRQVQCRQLRALVVARSGAAFEPEYWPQSRTLWQGDQEGLLVADNQTRSYANGDLDRRRVLSALAWGSQADPSPPAPVETRPSK
jgi:hypothetical protein